MKRIVLACLLVFTLLAVVAYAEQMRGLITCSKCKHTDAAKAQDCAASCVKGGVPAVFYNPATKQFYNIANQDKVQGHVGHRVVVTGTVQGDTLTIDTLKMAGGAKKGGGKKGGGKKTT